MTVAVKVERLDAHIACAAPHVQPVRDGREFRDAYSRQGPYGPRIAARLTKWIGTARGRFRANAGLSSRR